MEILLFLDKVVMFDIKISVFLYSQRSVFGKLGKIAGRWRQIRSTLGKHKKSKIRFTFSFRPATLTRRCPGDTFYLQVQCS